MISKKNEKRKSSPRIHPYISSANFYRRIQILIDTGKDLTLINFKFETRIREFVPRVRTDQWQGWLLAVARSYLLDHAANDDRFISILITRED